MKTKIYVIVRANAYDGFDLPEDNCFTDKDQAQKQSDAMNIAQFGRDKKYWSYDVHELYLN